MQWLDGLTLFATLFMCGNELAISAFVNPALWRRNNQEMAGEFASSLGSVMPFWYGLCLVLLGMEAFLRRHGTGHRFLFVSTALWAGIILYTVLILVPLNNQLASINKGAAIPYWMQISKKWDTLHRFRVALLTIAAALFYLGLRS